jgi:hypothetical protein
MSLHRKCGTWISSGMLAWASLLLPTIASAAPLPCVQRAIAWKDASVWHFVTFAMVSLHESGEGGYASGNLENANCTRAPWAEGTVRCLVTIPGRPVDALLLHPLSSKPPDFLRGLSVDVIPSDTLAQVHLRQPHATYDFDPRCVGNLLVGNDQWGNHWTVSFRLDKTTVVK